MPGPDEDRPPTLALLRDVPFGIGVLAADGTLLWANAALLRTAGIDSTAIGRDLHVDPRWSAPGFWPEFDRSVRSHAARIIRALPLARDGVDPTRRVDVAIQPTGPTDRSKGTVVVLTDEVTDRERARERERLFYESFQTSTNAIEVTDRQGFIVDVNPAYEKIYGYPRADCLGQRPSLVSDPSTPRSLYTRMWADLLDPSRGHWSGELVNRDRAGGEHPVFLTITAIRNASGETTHYLGVAVDLTEQRRWERQAAHADKLASLGQLAAGVAHEINTPLASVMLITESLRRKTEDEGVRRRLDKISEQVEVAARIVRSLLDFARRSEPQLTEFDLRDVARDSVEFLRGKQSPAIGLDAVYPAEPVRVHGDRGQLMQVLTNILNNAYEAMEGTGRIRLEVRERAGTAEIEISDTGPGIPEKVMPHIFEPFFTTKPEGKGTGLGLAICHGIVQAHNGTVAARNRAEGGASFLLTLPIATAPSPSPWETSP